MNGSLPGIDLGLFISISICRCDLPTPVDLPSFDLHGVRRASSHREMTISMFSYIVPCVKILASAGKRTLVGSSVEDPPKFKRTSRAIVMISTPYTQSTTVSYPWIFSNRICFCETKLANKKHIRDCRSLHAGAALPRQRLLADQICRLKSCRWSRTTACHAVSIGTSTRRPMEHQQIAAKTCSAELRLHCEWCGSTVGETGVLVMAPC